MSRTGPNEERGSVSNLPRIPTERRESLYPCARLLTAKPPNRRPSRCQGPILKSVTELTRGCLPRARGQQVAQQTWGSCQRLRRLPKNLTTRSNNHGSLVCTAGTAVVDLRNYPQVRVIGLRGLTWTLAVAPLQAPGGGAVEPCTRSSNRGSGRFRSASRTTQRCPGRLPSAVRNVQAGILLLCKEQLIRLSPAASEIDDRTCELVAVLHCDHEMRFRLRCCCRYCTGSDR